MNSAQCTQSPVRTSGEQNSLSALADELEKAESHLRGTLFEAVDRLRPSTPQEGKIPAKCVGVTVMERLDNLRMNLNELGAIANSIRAYMG